ncbi:RORA protein, partial [Oceanites oceanicus]|nr:RORA protein [Oceanites oceanicus]
GFFRRSQQSSLSYACSRQQNCPIDRASRNRCQHCRLQKCLRLGMSRDAVKFGRMSKKQRDRLHAEVQQQLEQRQREAEGAPAVPLGLTGCRGHPLSLTSTPGCPGTRHGGTEGRAGPTAEAEPGWLEGTKRGPDGDGDRDGDRDGPDFYPHPDGHPNLTWGCDSPMGSTGEVTVPKGHPNLTWGCDSPMGSPGEVTVPKGHPNPTREVTVPRAGAAGAPTQPQAAAPRGPVSPVPPSPSPSRCRAVAGAMEVVLVRMCRAFNSDNRTVFFEGKYAGTELFRSLGCHELISSIFDFAQSLCALHFSESEVAFFSALVLVNASEGPPRPPRPRFPPRPRRNPNEGLPKTLRFCPKAGAGLPSQGRLRALCAQHVEQLQAFRRLHPGVLHAAFPPLYRELFASEAETPGSA